MIIILFINPDMPQSMITLPAIPALLLCRDLLKVFSTLQYQYSTNS